jgi:hypothetical protein
LKKEERVPKIAAEEVERMAAVPGMKKEPTAQEEIHQMDNVERRGPKRVTQRTTIITYTHTITIITTTTNRWTVLRPHSTCFGFLRIRYHSPPLHRTHPTTIITTTPRMHIRDIITITLHALSLRQKNRLLQ